METPTLRSGLAVVLTAFAPVVFASLVPVTLTGTGEARAQQTPDTPPARAWIGLAVTEVDRDDPGGGADAGGGLLVRDVFRGGPAHRAGLRPGDAIVRVAGDTATAERILRVVRGLDPGQAVELAVRRDGELRTVDVTAAPRPRPGPGDAPPDVRARIDSLREAIARSVDSLRQALQPLQERRDEVRERRDGLRRMRNLPEAPARPPPPSLHILGRDYVAGARVTPLNPDLADYFAVEDGVLVTEVLEGSPAGDAGLRPGDVIVSVDAEPTTSVAAVRAALARGAGSPSLEVVRQGERTSVELPR